MVVNEGINLLSAGWRYLACDEAAEKLTAGLVERENLIKELHALPHRDQQTCKDSLECTDQRIEDIKASKLAFDRMSVWGKLSAYNEYRVRLQDNCKAVERDNSRLRAAVHTSVVHCAQMIQRAVTVSCVVNLLGLFVLTLAVLN